MKTSARQLLDDLLDPGSFVSWDRAPIEVAAGPEYRAELEAAAARTGLDEAVLTGAGLLRGRPVAVIACEFGFLAGSIGVAAAELIVTAVERATERGLPLLASPTSGGTRMQEGTVAFVQMVKIAGAVAAHKAAGHPYLVYLRDPTMGGVFASWGSLGHMTFAEPGALIGFLGPRVYEALYGHSFPAGVQTAENLYRSGVIDGVLPVPVFRRVAHRVLNVVCGRDFPHIGSGRAETSARDTKSTAAEPNFEPAAEATEKAAAESVSPAWTSVVLSRRPDRPGLRQLLRRATDRVPLSGTGQGEADRTVVHALARFHGRSCVVFGHDRSGQTRENTMGPAALREARRSMHLAAELRLPLVLVIDTAGASLSREAEERGLAPEIARCLADLVTLDTPTVSVLLGQGTGGGALALLPADRVLAAAHAWLAPLPPEGASAIVFRDTAHAPELAVAQRIRAYDLHADGIVDRIVGEYPNAAAEPTAFAGRMVSAIAETLDELRDRSPAELRADRRKRYRRLGLPQ
ncbi:carboxyl transferase domain-containing protein [Nocardia aurantia]|uniref:Putative acetyl-coenzyme A carboxylase carboxyl transferase subunit beta n=1 Tax=Nocardia aurantia TaxID=2585199 RepID=A0A7K0DG33_9NOCA|nr:carboxyl transferase domain-containing protein [Nocardia aurantia]MQY24765.1 putative acetyl-coenzyme A carboxylase carboxyl transferase subunit beta [Nocardia aurantia]